MDFCEIFPQKSDSEEQCAKLKHFLWLTFLFPDVPNNLQIFTWNYIKTILYL